MERLIKIMFKGIFILSLTIQLCSCSKQLFDSNYKGENNYDSFYLVDTIKIPDPIKIHSIRLGGQFIISKETLKYYSDKPEFFNRPDVFIWGEDLYRDIPAKKNHAYHYPDYGGCDILKSSNTIAGLDIYEFKRQPKFFLLGLINSNYYYLKHNSYGEFSFKNENKKFTFYKIAYPFCE